MKYLKFMPANDITFASRNKRELSVANEYGYDCYCYCDKTESTKNAEFDDFTVIVSKHPKPPMGLNKFIRLVLNIRNVFTHSIALNKLKADIISCHNVKSLAIAYFAYLFVPKSKKPKFIYDSHEFELKKKNRNKISYTFFKNLEGFLIKRCTFTIMVNDYIAESVAKIHNYDYNRVVVRSTPPYWNIDEEVSLKMHDEICEKLQVAKDSFIVLYHGLLIKNRGLEEIYKAMTVNDNFYTITVGDYQSDKYKKDLFALESEYGIKDRIIHFPIQPHSELWKYISAVDCGIVMMNADNKNYAVSLPNKFFENIQSLTPIICTDSVEMGKIIAQYDIGLVSPSGDGEKLALNIERMRTDKELYAKFKKNLVKAKSELCWEKEKEKLIEAFDKYL